MMLTCSCSIYRRAFFLPSLSPCRVSVVQGFSRSIYYVPFTIPLPLFLIVFLESKVEESRFLHPISSQPSGQCPLLPHIWASGRELQQHFLAQNQRRGGKRFMRSHSPRLTTAFFFPPSRFKQTCFAIAGPYTRPQTMPPRAISLSNYRTTQLRRMYHSNLMRIRTSQ